MRYALLALACGCGAQPVHGTVDAAMPPDLTVLYDFSVAANHDFATLHDMAIPPDQTGIPGGPDLASKADLEINYCVVQFPKMTTTQANVPTELIYGQIYQQGLTDATMNMAAPGIVAELGAGPANTDPITSNVWKWFAAVPNPNFNWAQNNDEYQAQAIVAPAGNYWYVYRFSVSGGAGWTYCDTVGNGSNNGLPAFDPMKSGQLTVN